MKTRIEKTNSESCLAVRERERERELHFTCVQKNIKLYINQFNVLKNIATNINIDEAKSMCF